MTNLEKLVWLRKNYASGSTAEVNKTLDELIMAASLDAEQEVENLDARMKAAGMYTVAEMMGITPLTRWTVHAGMNNLDFFSEWLDRKVSEYLAMKAGYELGDKDKDDELYEWVLAHAGAFSTIRENFRAAREGSTQTTKTGLVEILEKALREITSVKAGVSDVRFRFFALATADRALAAAYPAGGEQ